MKNKKLTKKQKSHFFRHTKEQYNPFENSIIKLESGEEFLLYFKFHLKEDDPVSSGFTLYALPLEKLQDEKLDFRNLPQAKWFCYETVGNSNSYPYDKIINKHIVNHYSYMEFDFYRFELNEINMGDYQSKGLGSIIMQTSLDEIYGISLEPEIENLKFRYTHIFGEMDPLDENRWDDLERFYGKYGFDNNGLFIWKKIEPSEADLLY